ncbi:hypothetical protein BHAOGJBA_4408 [Methylobacterium hispanicum]|uniref:GNAT family N-acetyltransferase n=1 Tax=Methylobacterium hispanicum TaxID=270350 RepID=A0AAV4ZSA9_9HYPH|nr:hypothetical protein [Methylobacterium hispanicum]GJD90865.1 hypothetical protein BHAOGJBA_4408 [Methylobacterium hispanicum]
MTEFPLPRAVWGVALEQFVGPGMVAPAFGVDGRSSDYDLFREAPWELAPAWTSPDGRHAVHLVADADWEPPTSVLLETEGGTCVGFYAGGELWIDEDRRGAGLSTPLILCLVARLGKATYDTRSGLGFSPAGYAAHAAAHRIAVERAVAAGMRVPAEVRAEAASRSVPAASYSGAPRRT